MDKAPRTLVLDIYREGEKVRVSGYEKAEATEQTLRHYEEHRISITETERLCKEIVVLLNRANKRGDITPDIIDNLKKTGQALYDELLTPKIKNLLRTSASDNLLLYINDQLVQIPWELLFDGEEFLCLKYSMGRIVSTRQNVLYPHNQRGAGTLSMLIIADPEGNLDVAYKEGVKIRDEIGTEANFVKVNLASSKVDIHYVKKNIRDFDIIHYAGHADYNSEEPSKSSWVLHDGKWIASEILKLSGGATMPVLVFSNACHSGRTQEWQIKENFENEVYGLANAFLHSGVSHYIGTFWEILDSPSSLFAIEFYRALIGNASIGKALRDARKKLIERMGKNNIIWASYMLYGDPTFVLFGKDSISTMQKDKRPLEQTDKHEIMQMSLPDEKNIFRSTSNENVAKKQKFPRKAFYGIFALCALIILAILLKRGLYTEKKEPEIAGEQVTTSQRVSSLELSMNIIGQREELDGSVSEVLIKEGSILHSFDNFQVHFQTNRDAYVYILIYDSSNEAHLLFPDPKISISNNIKGSVEYSVPSAGQWFWLDENTGVETIYVLASEKPLDDIQRLLKDMEGVAVKEKKVLSEKIRGEIISLERGVGGITEGKAKSFKLKSGKSIQNITEIVKGTGAVVRAISFRHIDNRPFKDAKKFKDAFKMGIKGQTALKSDGVLMRSSEPIILNIIKKKNENSVKEKTITNTMKKIARNIILEESRGVGGVRVYKEACPAVVLVITNDSVGSGSVFDNQGHVLTNWHVIKDYERVVVFFKPEKGIELKKENAYAASVEKVDELSDLALLKLEKLPAKLPLIKLGSMDNVEVAQEVHAIGHPEGEIWTYTKGIISQIRPQYEWSYNDRIKHKSKVIQTQTPINPGNSGGPLLNDNIELIGVNSFTKRGEGLNFAVSVDVIKEFLGRKGSRIVQEPAVKKASTGDLLKNAIKEEWDVNNDSIVDVVAFDINRNGKFEIFIVDLNQDGKIDYIGFDDNENGKHEVRGYDTNNNKKIDTFAFDNDEDGSFDIYGLDYDEDGEIDEYVKA